MLVATYYIGSTGSHGDVNGFSPWLSSRMPEEMTGVADGVEALRKKVRYLIKNGADVIKFGASAGVLTEEASVGAPQFSQEEMNAIVDEAKLHGVKTCAHAHGTEAIKMAIRAGVDSIEHGSLIDDEGIRMMKERGTYLFADIYNDDYILAEYEKFGYAESHNGQRKAGRPKAAREFSKGGQGRRKDRVRHRRRRLSARLNAKQFAKMVEWGMTPMGRYRQRP